FFDVGLPICSPECKPGCNCGKYVEVWNDVFLFYEKQYNGTYKELKQKNIDTGMGLERMLSVIGGENNIFDIDLLKLLMKKIKALSGIKDFSSEDEKRLRIITDHIRSVTFMLADPKNITPSKRDQGYVIRRLIRRSMVKGHELGIKGSFLSNLVPTLIESFKEGEHPELKQNESFILEQLQLEEKRFSQTLRRGMRKFEQILSQKQRLTAEDAFMLFSTYGFPLEITIELLEEKNQTIDLIKFEEAFKHHQELSHEAAKERFQSGLSDHSEEVTQLHTATHLMHQALRNTLGEQVQQKSSNINKDRTRFDINFHRKLTSEEITEVEQQVNEVIRADLKVTKKIMTPEEAKKTGALAFFDYGEKVSVFTIGNFSKEVCTGPHVKRTSEIGKFKIVEQKKTGENTLRIRGIIKRRAESET
ncbi:MAG: alanine--tRNA ligase-related protein, partial [Candidatus Hodarchaeota archaeon]